jgi:hypothetical protein
MIFLTPHIIAAPTEVAAMSNAEEQRLKASKQLTEEELNRYLEVLPNKEPDPPKKKKK